jgi:rhodanese-related sulfurtransferase
MANIPENWYATNSGAVNEMLVNGEEFTLIDTRRPEEFAEGHVNGAVSIPLEELMADLSLLPDKEAKIVVYCKSGIRSAIATQALLMNGYPNALSMGGGILAWQAAELPTVQ